MSNFIFPTLFDNRNIILSILGYEWNKTNNIEEIIEAIPSFLDRVLENTTNKYLAYYGEIKIDEVYDVNHFLINPELNFFKCFQLLKAKSTSNADKLKKERYIILTDVYFLLLDPAPNYKNMAKLIFFGDIRNIKITKTDNYHDNEKAHSYLLEWYNDNAKIISVEVVFINSLFSQNFMLNPIQDFIDFVERKSNKLKDNFRAFHEDFYKPNDFLANSKIDNLKSFIKYNENKFSLLKNSFLANNLVMLYKKMHSYYKEFDGAVANSYDEKIQNILNIKEYESKVMDNYEVRYNIKNNYALSRSYSDSYNEDFI